MKSDWPIKDIEECSLKEEYSTQIGPFGDLLRSSEYVEQGVPVLRGVNVNQGRFHDSDYVFITEEKANQLYKYESFPNDILLVHKGTLGRIGIMPKHRKFPKYIMGNSMMRVRCDETILLSDYLYYWLCSKDGQNYIFSRVSQVGVPQIQTPLTTLRKASLKVPPIAIQKKTCSILTSLDRKIEVNEEINKILEKMSQAIFKSWFVDFDPVHAKNNALKAGLTQAQSERASMAVIAGLCSPTEYTEDVKEIEKKLEERLAFIGKEKAEELKTTASLFPSNLEDSELGPIPEGWEVNTLADVIQFNPTLSLKKNTIAKYVDMKSVPNSGHRINEVVSRPFGSGTKFQNGDVLMARITPCLENGKTAYVDCLTDDEVAWGSTEFIVMRPKTFIPDKWIYLLSRHPEFVAFAVTNMSGTSGRQRVSADVLGSFKIALPQNEPIFYALKNILEPFFEKIKLNSLESTNLAQLRDLLLPKLISGEIDLNGVSVD